MNAALRAAVIAEWRGLPPKKARPDRFHTPGDLLPTIMPRLGLREPRPSAVTTLSAVGGYVRQNMVIGVRDTCRRKIECGCPGEGYGGELCQRDAGRRRSATGKEWRLVDDNLMGRWISFKELVKEARQ